MFQNMDWRRVVDLVGFVVAVLVKAVKFLGTVIIISIQYLGYLGMVLWVVVEDLPEYVVIPFWKSFLKMVQEIWKILRGNRRGKESTNYCPQMVRDFNKLATKDLVSSREYLRAGHKVKNQLLEKLKDGRSGCKVARVKLAGSIGKGTAISYLDRRNNRIKNPDFDLVVFINDAGPPFLEVLNRFKEVVETSIPRVYNIRKSNISVQFTYYDSHVGEIKFDVLPAKNHVMRPPPSVPVGDVEARRNLEEVKRKHEANIMKYQTISMEDNKLHSSSFCEKTVEIIRTRVEHDFYLCVVRLAKYWNSCINLDMYVPARSCIIETVAIWSQRGKPKRCLIGGFRRFLENMKNLRRLVVQIGATKEDESDPKIMAIQDCFRESNILPIIQDPVNPYNNLARGIDSTAVRIFERQARKTIQVLEQFKRSSDYRSVENVIDEIFCHK